MTLLLRALLFFVLLLAVGLAVDSAAQAPGSLLLRWHGYEVQTTAAFAAFAAVAVIVAVYLFGRLMAWLDRLPETLWQARAQRRQQQGFTYLLEGMDALAAGDGKQARKLVGKAARLMPEQPLVFALQAETARRDGDHDLAMGHYKTLSDAAGNSFLGLKGLADEAMRRNDLATATHLVGKALAVRPRSAWALERSLHLALAKGEVYAALDMLPRLKQAEMTAERQAFLVACVRHAQAAHLAANQQPEQALAALNKGIRACPAFLPLYLLGADILTAQGQANRALRLLADGWLQAPRYEVFDRWASHYGPDYGKDFVAQATKLTRNQRDPQAGKQALAEAYIRAREWQKAADLLTALAEVAPNREVYRLLAQAEEGRDPTGAQARQYYKQALDARPWLEPHGYMEAFRQWTGRYEGTPTAQAAETSLDAPHKGIRLLGWRS
jgi:HemY protein